ncbi:DUF6678 family protein [uncultured Aquimarina sp.]|uniref:DUF6678 family protein n=1 Tax=uncultured Aquimarina sp. TaxID=575652 RepID=UPI00263A3ADF|nr:DUF6678 family protein [uncultured Aquimarina sp.]
MSRADKYQLKLQQEIDSRASFMNTTKWNLLFSIIKGLDAPYITQVKLLLDDKVRELSISNLEHLINQKYIEEYWGVFELKEIEWILIPSEIIVERKHREEFLAPKIKTQNIELIERTLQTGKQFEYELSELGLKIYGYK